MKTNKHVLVMMMGLLMIMMLLVMKVQVILIKTVILVSRRKYLGQHLEAIA
jgi:hypothetical protein